MYEQPTEEELAGLEVGPADTPPPSPAVVERADKLIDRLADGEAFTQVGDMPAAEQLSYPDSDKLAFMSHLLGGAPFVKTYELLGGELTLEFGSVDAATDAKLAQMVLADEKDGQGSQADRARRYNAYLLAASLRRVARKGEPRVNVDLFSAGGTAADWRKAYQSWQASMPRAQYLAIRASYRKFAKLLSELLERVDDPDFWPTPS